MNLTGAEDASKLLVFPAERANDPLLGDGVFYDNALTDDGNPTYTDASRRWVRREVLMIIRDAIHAVQQRFPGTTRLGIGDVGLQDGTTPEGHPNHTHDYGGNLDISYFIKPEATRAWGNMTYRQICCDADKLTDWDCVDTNTRSAGYGTCVAGSDKTHIVDAPRTALFLAKIAGSGRLRVVGVEAKVKKDIMAALDALVADSTITAAQRSAVSAHVATAEDDGSWIWHFNHMHASFWYDEAQLGLHARPPAGPWQGMSRAQVLEHARRLLDAYRRR
jgi:hypothetical protein